ncbi:MAG: glycosyltransferase family 9 protein [Planctomycetota bacterium]|jgi:ADP-heptose:LPS heptosyltransferase
MDAQALHQLSRQIAFSFMDRYFQRGVYEPAYIDLLCEMATFHSKPDLDGIASAALFGLIVEKLCDDFEELPVELYSRVMCQVVSFCRGLPAGQSLDKTLADFGLTSSDHLHQRAISTHTRQYRHDPGQVPTRIILLSRVTIGADVAILSVMIQRLGKLFPEADLVVVGSKKLRGLFDNGPQVRWRELNYARRGGLFERFGSWHATLDILREEMPPGGEEDVLVIDPDSRISQLGVLPLLRTDNYLFFNTRDHAQLASGRCMAELANDWMDAVFGVSDFCYPTVWVSPEVMEAARTRMDLLRASGAQRVVTVNLGVGQNPRKRVSLEFEKRLLRALGAIPETVVVLDRGFGADETERSWQLLADARHCGLPGLETRFSAPNFPSMSHGVLTVECGIAEMAALIAHSDEYLGYDSACQHIAAAVRTPTLTIFAGSNNMDFLHRWSACGDTECRIVHVNTLSDPRHIDVEEIIGRIMQDRANRTLRSPQQRIHEIRKARRRTGASHEPMKE